MKFPPRSLAIDIALDDDLVREISQVAIPDLGATPDERAVAQDTTALPLGDARRGTIYCALDRCPTCEYELCRCAQDPLSFFLMCGRCDRESDRFEEADECEETLAHEGWEIGRGDFVTLCPSCLDDINERDRVGRARFRR